MPSSFSQDSFETTKRLAILSIKAYEGKKNWLTSNCLVKLQQKERDAEKVVAEMKSEQNAILESLVKERTQALEKSKKIV